MWPIRNNGATVHYYCRARDKLPTKTVAALSHAQPESWSSSTHVRRKAAREQDVVNRSHTHFRQITIHIQENIVYNHFRTQRVASVSVIAPPLICGRGCCGCRLNRNKQKQMRMNTLADDVYVQMCFTRYMETASLCLYSIGSCTTAADWVSERIVFYSRLLRRCSFLLRSGSIATRGGRLCAGRDASSEWLAIECTDTKWNDKWRSWQENRSICGIWVFAAEVACARAHFLRHRATRMEWRGIGSIASNPYPNLLSRMSLLSIRRRFICKLTAKWAQALLYVTREPVSRNLSPELALICTRANHYYYELVLFFYFNFEFCFILVLFHFRTRRKLEAGCDTRAAALQCSRFAGVPESRSLSYGMRE